MEARDVNITEDAKRIVTERDIKNVKVGFIDVDGVMRGKYLSREKFLGALDHGFAFCDVVLGWDSNDQLYENVGTDFTGWHTGYADAQIRILPETCRDIPFEPETLFFLCEFAAEAARLCPRNVLGRVLERTESLGFRANTAFEYEFFMFNETPDSAREKGYRNLQPISPGFFGYSVLRCSTFSDLYHELLGLAETMEFPIEGIHTETGPGVIEAALAVTDAAEAADRAALFKTFVKVWAQRREMMATFMAKWSNDYPGQSGHIHLSLDHADGSGSAFFDADQPMCMSAVQRHFVAGQQRYMAELTAMLAQTVNAYSRMVPGFWAPTHATLGCENRTTALRIIPGSAKSQRVEFRLGSADANPYIVLAAALGSGLLGIERQLEPVEVVQGNAYAREHDASLELPTSLEQAAVALRGSEVARELFGDAFVDHYAGTRLWEALEYRKHVSDWEMQRYFEII